VEGITRAVDDEDDEEVYSIGVYMDLRSVHRSPVEYHRDH